MIVAVANHLWQSSLCALMLAVVTMLFRANRAQVRFGLWLAASLKFLIPFAPLVGLGEALRGAAAPTQTISPIWSAAAAPAVDGPSTIVAEILPLVWISGGDIRHIPAGLAAARRLARPIGSRANGSDHRP
jgi:beta-lactamase regulating signal transducer with metallopeptidase domain